ncbi:MAG: RsmE family RNA methyltransferase, partial [Dehalococcoidia bacterium]
RGRLALDHREARMTDDPLRRFFVDPALLGGTQVTITGDLAHRLARVLRYRPGDQIVLTSGAVTEYVVRLETASPRSVTGTIVGERPSPAEPSVEVILYQSLIRPNRFDFALEKCTEIGVSRFVPVINERTQIQEEPGAKRADRWRRIIIEAAEQCGRGRLPTVDPPQPFADALRTAPGLTLVPWEDERTTPLAACVRSLPERPATISVFIGPEGGYTNEEITVAGGAGAVLVTLGRRVLRSETAATVACGIILHELDE